MAHVSRRCSLAEKKMLSFAYVGVEESGSKGEKGEMATLSWTKRPYTMKDRVPVP